MLALRVAALLLLAVAFARPFFDTTGLLDRPMTVVALDRSYSMSGPGVFARARRTARDLIADAPAGHLVGVVAFDDAADVVFDASPDRGAAAAAVELVRPGAGATRYRVAVDAVVELVGSRDGRVVIITDLQRSGWDLGGEGIVPANVTIEVSDVGAMDHNLAVRAVQPTPTRVFGVVFNAGRNRTGDDRDASHRRRIGGVDGGDPGSGDIRGGLRCIAAADRGARPRDR